MNSNKTFLQKYWSAALALCFLLVILMTYRDYGITWDESVQATYGELVYYYFKSGFKDKSASTFLDLKFYGPAVDLLAASVYKVAGGSKFEVRHLLTALIGLLAVVGVGQFAGLFRNQLIVFMAPFALVLLPRFYGHVFNNPKDIPFACAFVWAMYAITLIFFRKQLAWHRTLLAGLAIGITLAIRAGGMLLFFYLFVFALYSFLAQANRNSGEKAALFSSVAELLKHALVLVCVAWLVMIAVWPWAHESPLVNPVRAFAMLNAFHNTYPELFEGKIFMSDKLPLYYLPKYFLITTPPFILLLFLFGMGATVYKQISDFRSPENFLYFVVQFWFLFPLLYVVIKGPNIYNGIRHFLFILPAVALMAAIGAAWLLRLLSARYSKLVYLFLVVSAVFTAREMVRLHPYQTTYFNFLVGGVKKAWKNYETDYWTASYKEAMEWVNERSRQSAEPVTVLVAANYYNRLCAEFYKDPEVKSDTIFRRVPERSMSPAYDYYIATLRYGMNNYFPADPVVHTVGRDGAVFTVIKKRRRGRGD